jgi:hypothetical protein
MMPASRSRSTAERGTFISSKMAFIGSGRLASSPSSTRSASRICFCSSAVSIISGVAVSVA